MRAAAAEHNLEEALLCLLAGGRGLRAGVPGLATTLMVRSLAQAMTRPPIQFTPDLIPGDVTIIRAAEHVPPSRSRS